MQIIASYLHLLAVAIYLGGTIAMEFVLGPAQKYIPPAQAQVVAQRSADRFLVLVWGSLALFPISGMLLFFSLGDQHLVAKGHFISSSYGQTLVTMMILWVVLVINGSLITFFLRPKLTRKASAGTTGSTMSGKIEEMVSAAKWIERITRADLVIALFIVLLGASLSYGNGIL